MLANTPFYNDPLTLFVIGLVLLILFFWYFATDVERRKRNVGTVLLFGVCALCLLAINPPKERLKGGIDILGGSSFTLRVQPREAENGTMQPPTTEQVDQAINILRKRLDATGTQEAQFLRQGEDRILVQMPGVGEEESAAIRTIIEKVARLELREVSRRSGEPGTDGKSLAQRVDEGTEIVPGYRAYNLRQKDEEGIETQQKILLNRRAALTGNDIANAFPSYERPDGVSITLNNAGTDKMIALTRNMQPNVDRIAIVLDGEVISAPVVNQVPLGKNFQITGLSDPGEPKTLSDALMNPLENPLIVEASNQVSAAYGSALIKQGIYAGIIGLAITFFFVLIYYHVAGIIAICGLLVNGIILFGVMAIFGFPFSLPGIAGMILTIGMAVDANVLIYERLREEIAAGKSIKHAINAAYEKAFSAIFDSNITSLITALILFWLASGTIKGFAVTLTIGLLASMFSAILITRVLFRWGVDAGILKKLSFLNLIPPTNIDFLGKRKISGMIAIALSIATFALFGLKGDKVLGVDFTGGSTVQFQLQSGEIIPIDDVNQALSEIDLTREAYPTEETNPATGTLLSIRCDVEDADKIIAKLRETIPLLAERQPGTTNADGETVPGSFVVSVSKEDISSAIGSTFLRQSILALVVGLIGILIYLSIRFEFSFAVGGFVSTLHDVVLTLGIIIAMGAELSLLHVGAILTVAGYSLNDTIVIYDRIRERLQFESGSVKDIMNEAINATLARTVLTSGTTIITVTILAVFGGNALQAFSITILVGLFVGTLSSVFIAAPIVLWWSNRKGGNLRQDVAGPGTQVEALPAGN